MFTIFDKLGGKAAAFQIIENRSGRKVTPRAFKRWRAERRIPAIAAMALIEECAERNIPFDPADCRAANEAHANLQNSKKMRGAA